jgi:hypothetical protein
MDGGVTLGRLEGLGGLAAESASGHVARCGFWMLEFAARLYSAARLFRAKKIKFTLPFLEPVRFCCRQKKIGHK